MLNTSPFSLSCIYGHAATAFSPGRSDQMQAGLETGFTPSMLIKPLK